jgi:VIT1/CCC1 family predicted Fe2+/Mn2+ transporter
MSSYSQSQQDSIQSQAINQLASLKRELMRTRNLLSPTERISEILFGLIMALTFTCTISITQADRSEIRSTLIAALGCNVAWGLVDAVMYILTTLADRGRNKNILHFVRTTDQVDKARRHIADALPPLVASVTSESQLEEIRKTLLQIPEKDVRVKISWDDVKIAIGLFFLVFISTFPVVIPFMVVKDHQLALRVSNAVAIILMFICGWLLASYGGYNKIVTSLILVVIGVSLVAITIALGG